jgi:hypothetical protein
LRFIAQQELILVLLCVELLAIGGLAQGAVFASTLSVPNKYTSSSSWAYGVVVPNGVQLEGGGKLSWNQANNVTAEVSLSRSGVADGEVLAVLSAMIQDGNVLQVAVGTYPGTQYWWGFAWVVVNVGSSSQAYQWLLNSSRPQLSSGALVDLSIFRTVTGWNFSVTDVSSRNSISGNFQAGSGPLKSGDQEVFALESYTSNSTVLDEMGNLTMLSLRVNTQPIVSGWYLYSSWDGVHNPLFIVGITDAPSFISATIGNGEVTWYYYSTQWTETPPTIAPVVFYGILSVLVFSVLTVLIIARLEGRFHWHGRQPKE